MKIKTYLSDPQWNRSFIGRFVWIYRSSGTLEWSGDSLIYSDTKRKIIIERRKIVDISLGRYPRSAKPITLNFIDIKYSDDALKEKRVFFTPVVSGKNPWFTPVWQTNKIATKYLEELKSWKQ